MAALGLHLDQRAALEVDTIVETVDGDRRQRCRHEDERQGDARPLVAHEVDACSVRKEVEALEVGDRKEHSECLASARGHMARAGEYRKA